MFLHPDLAFVTEGGSVGDDEDDDEDEEDSSMGRYTPVDNMSQDGCDKGEEGSDEEEEEDEEEYETMTVEDNEGANYDEKVDYKEEMDALKKMRGELWERMKAECKERVNGET